MGFKALAFARAPWGAKAGPALPITSNHSSKVDKGQLNIGKPL